MKVHRLIPAPSIADDPTTVDEAAAPLALSPKPDDLRSAHGVQLELPSVTLWVTQVKTERGWAFQIDATTPHAEAADGRVYSSASYDQEAGSAKINVWANIDKAAS